MDQSCENREIWKEMESEYATTVALSKSLPCLRSRLLTKDQTDFYWQGIQAFYEEPTMRVEEGMHQGVLGLSKNETSLCSAVLLTQFYSSSLQLLRRVRWITFFFFLKSDVFVATYACWFLFFPRDSVRCLSQCPKRFLCLQSKACKFNRFFFTGS